MAKAADCKKVTIRGKARKLCWGMKRLPARMALVIVSNTSPSGYKKKARKKAAKKAAKKASKKRGTSGLRRYY